MLGREHTGKVSKKFIGKFYFWGITLMSFTCSLFSDKVRCFNQSERALYGNFIVIANIDQQWRSLSVLQIWNIFCSCFVKYLCIATGLLLQLKSWWGPVHKKGNLSGHGRAGKCQEDTKYMFGFPCCASQQGSYLQGSVTQLQTYSFWNVWYSHSEGPRHWH